jgi:hypothetical protein
MGVEEGRGRDAARTGNMQSMTSSAAGTVISPARRLCERTEIHPVSHGNTEPPKPQVASIHRESEAL